MCTLKGTLPVRRTADQTSIPYGTGSVRHLADAVLNRRIRALHNYTEALPDARFESALRGRHFDAYVRWILVEGLGVGTGPVQRRPWWPDWLDWMTCPVEPDHAPNYTDPSGVPVCPLAWARDTHRVGCVYAMAPPVPAARRYAQAAFRVPRLPDVSAPSYLAPIEAYVLRLMQRQDRGAAVCPGRRAPCGDGQRAVSRRDFG